MLSGEELAVDKVLAAFGRAEARDFLDLMAVEPRDGLDRLASSRRRKTAGSVAWIRPTSSALRTTSAHSERKEPVD